MNNWCLSNMWWKAWQDAVLESKKSQTDAMQRCAVISQMNYVCYLAQEWAGARK